MAAVSKTASFYILDDIVNEYNNTFHRTIKMKSINAISNSYSEGNVGSNKKDAKFQVGDHVIISKYKNIKDKLLIGRKKLLLLAKLKIQFHGVMR